MFNLGNILKAAVAVAAVAHKVIRHVAKSSPQVAKAVQAVDSFVQQVRKAKRDSHSDDGDKRGSTAANRGNRSALKGTGGKPGQTPVAKPTSDIAASPVGDDPDDRSDGEGDAAQSAPTLRELAAEVGLDIDEWIQGQPMTAELMLMAAESTILATGLHILRLEPNLLRTVIAVSPSIPHAWATLIAQYEIGMAETEALTQFAALVDDPQTGDAPTRLMTPEQIELLLASDAAWAGGSTYSKVGGNYQMVRSGDASELFRSMPVLYQESGNNEQGILDCSAFGDEVCKNFNQAWERLQLSSSYAVPHLATVREKLGIGLESGKLDSEEIGIIATEMSRSFGYNIEWGSPEQGDRYFENDQQRAAVLMNLLISNLHGVASLDEDIRILNRMAENDIIRIEGRTSQTGYNLYRQRFGEPGQVTIYLGADDAAGGASQGLTPLPASTDNPTETRRIYIGSAMSVPGITHELEHQTDRSQYPPSNKLENHQLLSGQLRDLFNQIGLGTLRQDVVGGFEAVFNLDKDPEIFADLRMTSVLDQQGYEGYSLGNYAPIEWNRFNGEHVGTSKAARIATTAFLIVTSDPGVTRICVPKYDPFAPDPELICFPDK